MKLFGRIEELRAATNGLLASLEAEEFDIARVEKNWDLIADLWREHRKTRVGASPVDVSKSPETNRGRTYDVAKFEEYRRQLDLSLTAPTIVQYGKWLLEEAQYRPGSVYRAMASISNYQRMFGATPCLSDPEVRSFCVSLKMYPSRPKNIPVVRKADVKMLLGHCPMSTLGYRDRLVILLLWHLRANRRLVDLKWDQVIELPGGTVQFQLKQEMPPLEVSAVDDSALCLDVALTHWVNVCGRDGYVLRGVDRHGNVAPKLDGQAINLLLQKAATRAGLNPAICIKSFRRSTVVSPIAIARIGLKGIAA